MSHSRKQMNTYLWITETEEWYWVRIFTVAFFDSYEVVIVIISRRKYIEHVPDNIHLKMYLQPIQEETE